MSEHSGRSRLKAIVPHIRRQRRWTDSLSLLISGRTYSSYLILAIAYHEQPKDCLDKDESHRVVLQNIHPVNGSSSGGKP